MKIKYASLSILLRNTKCFPFYDETVSFLVSTISVMLFEPTEYNTSTYKKSKKALHLIVKSTEKHQATITDEQKELFSPYTDAICKYQTIPECPVIQNSFRLSTKTIPEVMKKYNDNQPFSS